MAFFEQLGKRITDAGQGVAQQTKNFADITRLNSAVSDKERKIAQLYQSIGQSYYEQHSGDAEPQLQPAVEEIKALFAEIAQHKEEIKQIKGIVKCPHCGRMCRSRRPSATPAARKWFQPPRRKNPQRMYRSVPSAGRRLEKITCSAHIAVQSSRKKKIRRDKRCFVENVEQKMNLERPFAMPAALP